MSLKVIAAPGVGSHLVQPLGPKPGMPYCSRTGGYSMGGAGGFSGSVLRQSCRVKGAKSYKAVSKSRKLPSVLTNLISQGKVDGAQQRSLTD